MFHIATIDLLYLLPAILYLPPQHRGEYHLDIRPKRIVVEVVAVDADFVGKDDVVVVPEGDLFVRHGGEIGFFHIFTAFCFVQQKRLFVPPRLGISARQDP